MTKPDLLIISMIIAAAIVFVIHCNIWYYSLTKEERKRLDDEARHW